MNADIIYDTLLNVMKDDTKEQYFELLNQLTDAPMTNDEFIK